VGHDEGVEDDVDRPAPVRRPEVEPGRAVEGIKQLLRDVALGLEEGLDVAGGPSRRREVQVGVRALMRRAARGR